MTTDPTLDMRQEVVMSEIATAAQIGGELGRDGVWAAILVCSKSNAQLDYELQRPSSWVTMRVERYAIGCFDSEATVIAATLRDRRADLTRTGGPLILLDSWTDDDGELGDISYGCATHSDSGDDERAEHWQCAHHIFQAWKREDDAAVLAANDAAEMWHLIVDLEARVGPQGTRVPRDDAPDAWRATVSQPADGSPVRISVGNGGAQVGTHDLESSTVATAKTSAELEIWERLGFWNLPTTGLR